MTQILELMNGTRMDADARGKREKKELIFVFIRVNPHFPRPMICD